MKIKVRPSRLLSQLQNDRFVRERIPTAGDSIRFVRETSQAELFEWIIVSSAGKRCEAVWAEVASALTRTILVRDLFEKSLMLELAGDQERGWRIIETDAAAREWESELVAAAPQNVERLTHERGGQLLERTESLRRAVRLYVARLDLSKAISHLTDELSRDADPKGLGVAQRVAWDVKRVDDEEIYALAWLCVTNYESEIEETATGFSQQNPYSNPELLWRIHLIADWIMRQRSSITVQEA
jgi:hypothetical protein